MASSIAPPLQDGWINPADDSRLLMYFRDVGDWHGYAKFLGLPYLSDNPDIPLEKLYVEPMLSQTYCAPEAIQYWPPRISVIEALKSQKTLVVLGDPGSGKSTLVSWVAYVLSRQAPNRYKEELGWLVPLPFILRELKLPEVVTPEILIDAFLEQPVANNLSKDLVYKLLSSGQALVLLDGLDEVASLSIRKALSVCPAAFLTQQLTPSILITSRIVGFEESPIENPMRFGRERELGTEIRSATGLISDFLSPSKKSKVRSPFAKVTKLFDSKYFKVVRKDQVLPLYVCPFDDEQIALFAHNWHRAREGNPVEAEQWAGKLIESVHSQSDIENLARVPNLLTMMGIVHKQRLRLPHGRALLYHEIAEVYLGTLDLVRGLRQRFSLKQAEEWLSFVGWQMQLRRTEGASEGAGPERAILVDRKTLQGWLRSQMEISGITEPDAEASEFTDFVGRRSGLLLPRGEGQYAFLHLSFQEYFAAVYFSSRAWAKPFLLKGEGIGGLDPSKIRNLSRDSRWHETLLLAFELGDAGWTEDVLPKLFGEPAPATVPDERIKLIASIALDPHSPLNRPDRISCWERVWRYYFELQRSLDKEGFVGPGFDEIVVEKFGSAAREGDSTVWEAMDNILDHEAPVTTVTAIGFGSFATDELLRRVMSRWAVSRLSVDNDAFLHLPEDALNSVKDLNASEVGASTYAQLDRLPDLETLVAQSSPDPVLPSIQHLRKLESLILLNCPEDDLSPISHLQFLQTFTIADATISDLTPMSTLVRMKRLGIYGTRVKSLDGLQTMKQLESLDISRSQISDLTPLTHLSNLISLEISSNPISDLSPINVLSKLRTLGITRSPAEDFLALVNLTALEVLYMWDCPAQSLPDLRGLRNLRVLVIANTKIADLSSILGMQSLRHLDISGTPITDLSPIGEFRFLESLDLHRTPATDLSPLRGLTDLKQLIVPLELMTKAKSLLAHIPDLDIYAM